MKPRNPIVMVCPQNGEAVRCKVRDCRVTHAHRREELVPPWRPVPSCETHKMKLVAA